MHPKSEVKYTTRSFMLLGDQQRNLACAAIQNAPVGIECLLREPVKGKSRDQEAMYHDMLSDIAKQCRHLNLALDLETWKRLAIDQFKRDTLKDPQCCAEYWARNQLSVIPSLDGSAVVVLGEQSRRFPKAVASCFIEWLFAWGANNGVLWPYQYKE